MLFSFLSRYRKLIALLLLNLFYSDGLLAFYSNWIRFMPVANPCKHSITKQLNNFKLAGNTHSITNKPFSIQDISIRSEKNTTESNSQKNIGGPGQPEMQSFQSVNSNNMVDLFSGDFSYNIPLLDVGGYPINLSYHSGITMDQEASWVGLGWNINPGTITRNLRGLPDDFTGAQDSIKKTQSIKENKTIGVNAGSDLEITGVPLLDSFRLGYQAGIFNNNYKGWGTEVGLNAAITSGQGAKGFLSGGLSITANSQDGFGITPTVTLSAKLAERNTVDGLSTFDGSISLSAPYNTRGGLKGLQFSTGINKSVRDIETSKQKGFEQTSPFSSFIGFANPTFNPTINIPYTTNSFTFNVQLGSAITLIHPNTNITGYVSRQFIADKDKSISLPAYGYLNYQYGKNNPAGLMDFNREKEIAFREKPAVPNIAIPNFTYDLFSISGEGTGGMFRAYRGDIGYVYDHSNRTKDESDKFSIDLGTGNLLHAGIDINVTSAYTETGPWVINNAFGNTAAFKEQQGFFEASYFRNPGEKAVNSKTFYNAIGGEDLVRVDLSQAGISTSQILATNNLIRYRNNRKTGIVPVNASNSYKASRDKRNEVITYLTASEADAAGFAKYIENYAFNQYPLFTCQKKIPDLFGDGFGLTAEYFDNEDFSGVPAVKIDTTVDFHWNGEIPIGSGLSDGENFSVRWTGYIKPPVTGQYTFKTQTDDGSQLWINDSIVINNPGIRDFDESNAKKNIQLNLVKNQFYSVRLEMKQHEGNSGAVLFWLKPGTADFIVIPPSCFFPAENPDTLSFGNVSVEKRINTFRKPNHISEIDVLNPDGRRYIYGLPVYNLRQKEVSFSVDGGTMANMQSGFKSYTQKSDSPGNQSGLDNYYSSEETPAYAHSFLLTAIVSQDYADMTGNGISDDDKGDAIKFNYTKTAGYRNPYTWRTPYTDSGASFNEGFHTDNRDDKAHYIYGEKELWYLNSIESKNMIAVFTLGDRIDLLLIDSTGNKKSNPHFAKRLEKIDLYSKTDFLQHTIANAIPIKTVHFSYSYTLCKGVNEPGNHVGKLTLQKIWFTYNGNDKGEKNAYTFYYNKNNPDYTGRSYDRWGNYKDPFQNPGSKAGDQVTNNEYPYAIQDSDIANLNAAAWTLDSIKLPSNGRIKVNYESDDYAYVQHKRCGQMFRVIGLSPAIPQNVNSTSRLLYSPGDNLYITARVSNAVKDAAEVYTKYLKDLEKIYFKLNVQVPRDQFGSGFEYIPVYAEPDITGNWFGTFSNDKSAIWFKIKGVSDDAQLDGSNSPLTIAALQFLRLNLPSKAYPGSELGSDIDVVDAVKILTAMAGTVTEAVYGFSSKAKNKKWMNFIDTSRSIVRLNNPLYKKSGGGLRVKNIKIYDSWKSMTGNSDSESVYGQEYTYTTSKNIDGKLITISSGVASWEPMLGGDENSYHQPLEFGARITPLAPITNGYTELPLGESFYPTPSVGYSEVKVRSINANKRKSGNGYEITRFYTAYDFPTINEFTGIDGDSRKFFKPRLQNFLKINSKYFVGISQGFKIELNDMHGKIRSQATYPENDSNYIAYTGYYYKVDNYNSEVLHLSNTVATIAPTGIIDTTSLAGEDVELMTDMREQRSITQGFNFSPNTDAFLIGTFPAVVFAGINMFQRDESKFQSVATTKIVQRFGILDSVVQVDKGSKISTKNLLYDAETGDVVLTRTQNEFNDPIFNFNYPAYWTYKEMGRAYTNINAVLSNLQITNGRITGNTTGLTDTNVFNGGDELLAYTKPKTDDGANPCDPYYASFPLTEKIWAIDSSVLNGGPKKIYFIDEEGNPFTGNNVFLKIIRSGKRNMDGNAGTVTSLGNPLVYNNVSKNYDLIFSAGTKILNASAATYKQLWQVQDVKLPQTIAANCSKVTVQDCNSSISCNCVGLKALFDYLIDYHKLFTKPADNATVEAVCNNAIAAGYPLSIADCPILNNNRYGLFYALTFDAAGTIYRANIGNCIVSIKSVNSNAITFNSLHSQECGSLGKVAYYGDANNDTITTNFKGNRSMIVYNIKKGKVLDWKDSTSSSGSKISTEYQFQPIRNKTYPYRKAYTVVQFSGLNGLMTPSTKFISATLKLSRDTAGHEPPNYPNAYSTPPTDTSTLGYLKYAELKINNWNYNISSDSFINPSRMYKNDLGIKKIRNEDLAIDITNHLNGYASQNLSFNTFKFFEAFGQDNDTDNPPGPNIFSQFSTFYSEKYSDTAKFPKIAVKYVRYDTSTIANLRIDSCMQCTPQYSVCQSLITGNTVNPYKMGLLANYHLAKNYVYYSTRSETDPAQQTNIRSNGTFASFAPFWVFQNNSLQQQTDTTKWVWNTESTAFNKKGFEVENKDPLGRYNAGVYGYNDALPVAVVQNSKFKDAGFDGFEDYGYISNACDTGCLPDKHLDFTAYSSTINSAENHTGKYSLKVTAGTTASINFPIDNAPIDTPTIKFNTTSLQCSNTSLATVSVSQKILLPNLSPSSGKLLLSAWVKESGADCNCISYSNNAIEASISRSSGSNILFSLHPAGKIIEGWQRYEDSIKVPMNATSITLSLKATGTKNVFFDDIRIHPFNANMKSYVYDPVSLRLMAELDENNYATFYEYDNDGTLIRVKKETERGIKTIKETRSFLTNNQ